MSFLARIPFLPPAGSSGLLVTKSIFDMTFIQGISRFTIADIADKTPLREGVSLLSYLDAFHKPEKFVFVLHELRFNEV